LVKNSDDRGNKPLLVRLNKPGSLCHDKASVNHMASNDGPEEHHHLVVEKRHHFFIEERHHLFAGKHYNLFDDGHHHLFVK